MNRIYELQKKIETARHELDEALLQENRFEYYYEKSTRLDKLPYTRCSRRHTHPHCG